MSAGELLLVEDEAPFREFTGLFLEAQGFRVSYAADGRAALAAPHHELVLLDLDLPDLDGLEVLRRLHAREPAPRVVVLTGFSDAEHAVQALKAGAVDYLTKPVELNALLQAAKAALAAPAPGPPGPDAPPDAPWLVGADPAWRGAVREVERAAAAAGLLLEGPPGAGKGALAECFHRLGPRRDGPLLTLDCGAAPGALLAGELFGIAAGSTGAPAARPGLIRHAAGGTLVLENANRAPAEVQARIARLLSAGVYRRVGASEPRTADVALVVTAATGRDERALERDLVRPLAASRVEVPSLRERGDDVVLVAQEFLRAALPGARFGAGALAALRDFPGGVGALRALVGAAAARAGSATVVERRHLGGAEGAPAATAASALDALSTLDLEQLLDALEGHYVDQALARSATQGEAAGLLGLDRFALSRRRRRLLRLGGAGGARELLGAAPRWARAMLGEHPSDLPDGGLNLVGLRSQVQAAVVLRALRACEGNRSRAAELVGMSRSSFCRRLPAP